MSHTAVIRDLNSLADPERANTLSGFFKTGAGQYGEGDIFLGITVPEQRAVARCHCNLDLAEIEMLLQSPIHEHRLTALIILVEQYRGAGVEERRAIYQLYLRDTKWINNWDLVDASAEYIVGPELQGKDDTPLVSLAHSPNLWERRIGMVACFHYIKQGESAEALKIAEILEHDTHDLIQKAVGWMLREIGKRCSRETLERWLLHGGRYQRLPRTMLRYAIERFEPERRKAYLKGTL